MRRLAASLIVILTHVLCPCLTRAVAAPRPEHLIPGMVPGESIPDEVEALYTRGLAYLAASQNPFGGWDDNYGSQPAVVGLAILAFLAHGEDPNFGPHADTIHKAVKYLIATKNQQTGMFGTTMYNHGFATLAIAEAYGAVDIEGLGTELQQAVDFILAAQKRNAAGAWRYGPTSTDADITVSGAQVVALMAARNAGIRVPDAAVRSALGFMAQCQAPDGSFNYTPGNTPQVSPRGSIAVLSLALAKHRQSPAYVAGVARLRRQDVWHATGHREYFLYYMSQALFHADPNTWRQWYALTQRQLSASQNGDGSWDASHGAPYGTAMSLLSLALKYRFLPIYER